MMLHLIQPEEVSDMSRVIGNDARVCSNYAQEQISTEDVPDGPKPIEAQLIDTSSHMHGRS
jgi:hypothetical protein